MCPAQNQAVTEEMLFEFLRDGERRQELAQLFLDTLGSEGKKWLQERILQSSSTGDESSSANFARQIGAREVDSSERKILEINTLFNYYNHRKQLLANSLTAQEVAHLLGVTRQTIHDRIKDGKLIGLIENNTMRLPIFQFDPEGPNGVVPGLMDVFAIMNCNLLGRIDWMVTPNPVFDRKTPLDALKGGELASVMVEAQAIGVS